MTGSSVPGPRFPNKPPQTYDGIPGSRSMQYVPPRFDRTHRVTTARKSATMRRSRFRRLHPLETNKPNYMLQTADIDGAHVILTLCAHRKQPDLCAAPCAVPLIAVGTIYLPHALQPCKVRFTSERVVDPLVPRYKLPSYEEYVRSSALCDSPVFPHGDCRICVSPRTPGRGRACASVSCGDTIDAASVCRQATRSTDEASARDERARRYLWHARASHVALSAPEGVRCREGYEVTARMLRVLCEPIVQS